MSPAGDTTLCCSFRDMWGCHSSVLVPPIVLVQWLCMGVGWWLGVADPPLNQQSTCLARCARSDYGLVTAGRVIAGLSDSHQGVRGNETLMDYSGGCLLKHDLHL